MSIFEEFTDKGTLAERIGAFLTNAISEGRLKHGQRLFENELHEKFQTSRAPVREAFRILERKGLVAITPRKGTFVRKIDRKVIREIFLIRACLEALAARLAVENITTEDLKRMELALKEMEESAKNNDFRSFTECHSKFHETYINASKNGELIEIVEKYRRQSLWLGFTLDYFKEFVQYTIDIHNKILELLKKRETNLLEQVVKGHILFSLDKFLEFLPLE